MNKYSVRITNAHFTSATITVYAETKAAAQIEAVYGRTQFKVQWAKLMKRNAEKPPPRYKSFVPRAARTNVLTHNPESCKIESRQICLQTFELTQ